MACLHSVKQENNVRGTYLQRNNLRIKLRMLLTYIFFLKFPTELTCVVNQTIFRKYIFTLCLITVKNCLTGIPVAICQLFAFTCKEHWQGLPLSPLDPVSPFEPFSPLKYMIHTREMLCSYCSILQETVLQVVSMEMVVCYLLASLSVNVDGDWLLRICAKFLLIKEK